MLQLSEFFKIRHQAVILLLLFSVSVKAQKNAELKTAFEEISNIPVSIRYSSNLEINNKGGHLQGIQRFENNDGEYFFFTGSSEKYAYCTVLETANNKIISVNKLYDKPFKHAGGFQIFENFMAVGIEDNDKKDKSKVCIYDISKPEENFGEPITIIERLGTPFRNTAGCVGITKIKNKYLVAVGDWDTKNIDFYWFDPQNLTEKITGKICSIEIEKITKTDWINNEWNAYQNINLFCINDKLYLTGLGQNSKSEDIADLFEVTEVKNDDFQLKKIASGIFNCTNECSFKAGAGMEYKNGEFRIFACGYNTGINPNINIFGKKPR